VVRVLFLAFEIYSLKSALWCAAGLIRCYVDDELRAFSSEVDTGSREENASKQESRASVLIQSEPTIL
jgi:hypothetical protein